MPLPRLASAAGSGLSYPGSGTGTGVPLPGAGTANYESFSGAFDLAGLQRLMDRFPAIGDVRGLGLMIGVEITADRKTKQKAPELRDAIINECFRRGLLVLVTALVVAWTS